MPPPRLSLLYLVNARLPTEKAHGYQVAKMCEAFAYAGCDVELWHPRRRQPPAIGPRSLFEYYDIAPSFAVEELPNVDPTRLLDALPASLAVAGFSLHRLAWGLAAAAKARRRRADLFYARDPALALWLVLLGCPTVCELHRGASGMTGWVLRVVGARTPLRRLVTITAEGRRDVLAAGVSPSKVVVAHDAVDLDAYRGLPSRDECRRRLDLPADRPIVGYVGRLRSMEMDKGIGTLIEAISRMDDGVEAPMLVCVGGPADAAEDYRRAGARLGLGEDRLRFVGQVPARAVPTWIRACDVVTLPSPATPFFARFSSPMKLFEYLAAGATILASNLPAIAEVLTDQQTALFVAPEDPGAWAAGIAQLLDDPGLRQRLGANAAALGAEYSWEKRAAAILAASGIVGVAERANPRTMTRGDAR
ncbi:MAG TPA: glycosyltransferase family 4 protein [Actinomycetota bacterium]|nr:glycosyltransferase family 4 protein [Actinomycetota bacterium]